jgi:hypothetical protein
MSSDTESPRAGEDIGARPPNEDTARTVPPDGGDPYAGLSIDDLQKKLMEKQERQYRESLIRELEETPARPPPPPPPERKAEEPPAPSEMPFASAAHGLQ